jgi:FlgN protein
VTTWNLLSSQLYRECGLMELLLFKLQQEHLMLAAGQDRWLQHATAEVNMVMHELTQASATRTTTASALAGSAGLPPGATLGLLTAAAPSEWAPMLTDQREQLRALLGQIEQVGRVNREILASRLSVTRDALVMLGEAPAVGYGRDAYASRPMAHVVSEAL